MTAHETLEDRVRMAQKPYYRMRYQSPSLRRHVFARDQGICASCGFDTTILERELAAIADRTLRYDWLKTRGFPRHRTTFWDVDHIAPSIEGGDLNDTDNLQTLCIPCHRIASAEGARRRAEQRQAEYAAGRPRMRTMRWPG